MNQLKAAADCLEADRGRLNAVVDSIKAVRDRFNAVVDWFNAVEDCIAADCGHRGCAVQSIRVSKIESLDGLGPANLVPTLAHADLAPLALTAEEGFVLSRVDGRTSLADILLLVPFDRAFTISALKRLFDGGALDLPGVARPRKSTPAPAPSPVAPSAKDGALTSEQMARIDKFATNLDQKDAFQLLEVTRGADDKEIKRAYFRLSKEFHPDRFYGKEIGDYRSKVQRIFVAVKNAFDVLSDKERRAAYEESAGIK